VLSSRGLRVLRITNEEVHTDLEEVLSRIDRAVESSPSLQGRG
jgi:very-short-patch-repair endonuclease